MSQGLGVAFLGLAGRGAKAFCKSETAKFFAVLGFAFGLIAFTGYKLVKDAEAMKDKAPISAIAKE